MKKQKYTWVEFDRDMKSIVKEITKNPDFIISNVYGISRGGLVPAVMLSHLLCVDLVSNKSQIYNTTLIVDDVCDSGKTMQGYMASLAKKELTPYTLAIFYKSNSDYKPDFFIRKTKKWVVFPWETNRFTL